MSDAFTDWTYKQKDPIGKEAYKPQIEYTARMLSSMKDTVSEYMDEPGGEKLFFDHMLQAAMEQMVYHESMLAKIKKVIANLELAS